jgi:tripartite-type tricarboxylate transporter receptor subunit TctC
MSAKAPKLIAVALLLLTPTLGHADVYPSKNVRIIVPFAAGGTVDVVARVVAQKLAESFKKPVIVENRPGAGGNLAADAVAKSAPDGYTILLTTNGQAISPSLYRKLPYDTEKDLAAVTQVNASALVLVTNPKLGVNSVPELIALAKAKPGSLSYGSTGVGNPLHLTMEMLKRATGIDAVPIPYRGDAPLLTALLANEVPLAVTPVPTTLSHVQAGSLKALGVTRGTRSSALPDVPTIAEQGVVGFDTSSWHGFFVPAKTPKEIVMTIYQETKKALSAPEVRERLQSLGAEPVGTTPEEFDALFRADIRKFAEVIKEAGIPPQD